MREAIREYIELTDAEKAELWEKATFVFDTNVYLNLYRYSKKARDALLAAMRQLTARIWMPSHVAHEFMKRRLDVICESVNQYRALHDESRKFFETCTKALRFEDDDSEYKDLELLIQQVEDWLEEIRKKNLLVEDGVNDLILNTLLELYEGKVGGAFDNAELTIIKEEGAKRYAQKIPPGYKDAPKAVGSDDNNAFGDLIIWKEILKYAAAEHKDIVYITHDQKEDWWNIIHGETVGPRIELRKEFIDTTGQKFQMYKMTSFIERVRTDGKKMDQSVINEVERIHTIPNSEDENINIFNRLRYCSEQPIIQKLTNELNYLKAKNQKRRYTINLLKTKYTDRDMPEDIKEQIMNTEKGYVETELKIFQIKDELRKLTANESAHANEHSAYILCNQDK